jgi:serine/threonine protein kinase
LKHLHHMHLVRILLSYEALDGEMGFLMLPVADGDLGSWLYESKGISPITILKWFGCLASAMNYLYSKFIIHHDIKPSNILVEGNETYISDFGISFKSGHREGDMVDVPAFTPIYAGPEI